MKRNRKKGFTLIELLAVIVILAIISLIAVPIILNVIENARKSAAKSSVIGYIDAVEKSYALALVKKTDSEWKEKEDENGCYKAGDIYNLVQVKGNKPSSFTLVCLDKKHEVEKIENGWIDGYEFTYVNKEVIIGSKAENQYEENIAADMVSYSNPDSNVNNVQDALNDLYEKYN